MGGLGLIQLQVPIHELPDCCQPLLAVHDVKLVGVSLVFWK